MADSTLPAASRVTRWERKFYTEWIRDNRFSRITGADESAPIQVKEDLTKNVGKTIDLELVNRLTQDQTEGATTLEGNEEEMRIRNFAISVVRNRHAVVHDTEDEQYSAIDMVEAKNTILKDHALEKTRDRIIKAATSFSSDGVTHYKWLNSTELAAISETPRDAWLANNSDRVLFGAATSNNSSNDHSASLLNCDTTNDTLVRGTVSLAKRMAKTANPKIRPLRVREDEEWYILLAPSKPFADLAADLATINSTAMERGKDNPLFTGGDLIWDGVIVKEVPEIPYMGALGASSATVAACLLLGAQAVVHAIAKRTKMIENVRDYGAKRGAGYEMIDGIDKIYFGTGAADATTPKQNGILTLYVAYSGT